MTTYSRFLRKVRAVIVAMCTEEVLCRNRNDCAELARKCVQNEEVKSQTRRRAKSNASLSEEDSPVEEFSPTELYLASLKPIERFRLQYGNVAGILRERPLYDPHPWKDHAWIAARLVNVFGLYCPCVNFEQDYAAAVAEWETMNLPMRGEQEGRRARHVQSVEQRARSLDKALRDPSIDVRNIPEYSLRQGKETVKNHQGRSDSVMETAGKFVYSSAELSLALKHGTDASRKIIKYRIGENSNKHARGKQLHEKEVKRAEAQMLEDYQVQIAKAQEQDGLDTDWSLIPKDKESDDEEEQEPSDAAQLEPMTEVEGTYAVENGKPMVKVSSAKKLINMLSRR
jgi:hypothetical protein